MKSLTSFFLIFIVLVAGACGVKELQVKDVVVPAEVPDPAKPSKEFYVIGPGDLLNVVVWKDPSISGQTRVRPDGFVTLPLVNEIQVSGMSTGDLRKVLEEKYKAFVTDPFVTIRVEEIVSSQIFVIGEVKAPRPYPAMGNDTVLQMLNRAGGLTIFADRNRIRIVRRKGEKARTYTVNYDAILNGDFKQDILLRPGDRIIVP